MCEHVCCVVAIALSLTSMTCVLCLLCVCVCSLEGTGSFWDKVSEKKWVHAFFFPLVLFLALRWPENLLSSPSRCFFSLHQIDLGHARAIIYQSWSYWIFQAKHRPCSHSRSFPPAVWQSLCARSPSVVGIPGIMSRCHTTSNYGEHSRCVRQWKLGSGGRCCGPCRLDAPCLHPDAWGNMRFIQQSLISSFSEPVWECMRL